MHAVCDRSRYSTILSSSTAMDAEAWMDLFDDNSSEEGCEEQNPDDIRRSFSHIRWCPAIEEKKKTRIHVKKKNIILALEKLGKEQLSDSVGAHIVKQLHMQVCPERSQFFKLLSTKYKHTFLATLRCLKEIFCDQCEEKYI